MKAILSLLLRYVIANPNTADPKPWKRHTIVHVDLAHGKKGADGVQIGDVN